MLLMMMLAVCAGSVWWLVDENVSAWASNELESLMELPWLPVVGGVLIFAAVITIGLALLPGRRARHARAAGRVALVVDDGVLANSVVDRVSAAAGFPRAQISAKVRQSGITVHVTPTSGVAVDREKVRDAAEDAVEALGFGARIKVVVADRGVIA